MCLLMKDIIMSDLNGTAIVIVNRCTSDLRKIHVNQEPKKLEQLKGGYRYCIFFTFVLPVKYQFETKKKQFSSQNQENVRFDVTYPSQMLELSILNAKGKMTKISFVDQVLIELIEGKTTSKFYSTTKIHHFALKLTFSITFTKFGHS